MRQSKIDFFFEMLTAVYGRDKVKSQWPTDRDMSIVRALIAEKVESMSLKELRSSIDNARIMRSQEQRGWDWPDVDLILAGAKRYANASHRLFLPAPERDVLPRNQIGENARSLLRELSK
jgi:hypothetical protein